VGEKQLRFQVWNQPSAAIAATRTKNGFHFGVPHHLHQFRGAAFIRSGKIPMSLQNIGAVESSISETLQFPAAGLEHFGLYVACRRDDTDKISSAQCCWFDVRTASRHSSRRCSHYFVC